MFQLHPYLQKIGLSAAPRASTAGLFEIHRAQFFRLPFENLDIQMGREISLEPAALFEKLVKQQRGGYCFELNGLMLLALQTLGFNARSLLARVHGEGEPSGKTHQIIKVVCDGKVWLLDAGFGAGGPRLPLELRADHITREGDFAYRLIEDEVWGWILETWEAGQWKPSYSFFETHVSANDLTLGNFYTSHAPQSHFTQIRTVSLPTATGRISLRNYTLTRVVNNQKTRETVEPGQAYLALLKTHFGIDLKMPYDALKPVASA